MNTTISERQTARTRLLNAAGELFYREGVHTVGIDRVIEHAGVAKASLYNAFGSKDELIRAYLDARHAFLRERMEHALAARYQTPRARLLGIFDVQGEIVCEPGYRGCAFINASAESASGSSVERVSDDYRGWLHRLFGDLARDAGAPNPELLAGQLILLYDGVGICAKMDHDPSGAARALTVATMLVDLAIPPAQVS